MPLVPFDKTLLRAGVRDDLFRAPERNLYIYEYGTTTEAPVYDADLNVLTQPLESGSDGTFPDVWLEAGTYDLYSPGDSSTVPWTAAPPSVIKAVGDTDWDTAMLNESLAEGGITVIKNEFTVTEPILVALWGTALRAGDGTAGAPAARIVADHDDGPVLRFTGRFQSLTGVEIQSSEDREATAGAGTGSDLNVGILEEPEDEAGKLAAYNSFRNFRLTGHPSHGIVSVKSFKGTVIESFMVTNCAGHGIVADDGEITGRTNTARIGGLTIANGNIQQCGGHSVRLGQTGSTAYRCKVDNVDQHHCASDAAIRETQDVLWLNGQNCEITRNAFGGPDEGDDTSVGGVGIRGQNNDIINNRYIRMTDYAVQLISDTARGNRIDGIFVNPTTPALNPAVKNTVGAPDNFVRSHNMDGITKLMTVDASIRKTAEDTDITHRRKFVSASSFQSEPANITIADDGVAILTFDAVCGGVLIVSGSTSTAKGGICRFKVGASPHVTLWSGEANVVATTGALTGTTGTDGNLTISAHATDNTLYIENRTGASRTYQIALLAVSVGARYIGAA